MTDNLIKKLFKDADTDYIWLTEAVSRVDPCEKLRLGEKSEPTYISAK